MAQPHPCGSLFEQILIFTTWWSFTTSFNFLANLSLKKIFKRFSLHISSKYLTHTPLPLWPQSIPGYNNLIKLNILYLRILPLKFHLFCPNDFSEEFWKIPINFQWFNIMSPFKRVGPSLEQTYIPFTQ